jgi:hypothetical protein
MKEIRILQQNENQLPTDGSKTNTGKRGEN